VRIFALLIEVGGWTVLREMPAAVSAGGPGVGGDVARARGADANRENASARPAVSQTIIAPPQRARIEAT
jgi:hypothetical protein